MNFNKNNYTIEKIENNNESFSYRAFCNIPYVETPVNPDFQQMNIFAPEIYYHGGSINGYDINTAPVFMPNHVGGYKPGGLGKPECFERDGKQLPNTILRALMHGYVVAIPAIRGRDQQGENGEYNGKAPACIVDYKAAVRFIHFYGADIPGDTAKIITNGTSAGGALSSLMGATGNHPDYEPFLQTLGAAQAGDDIFAASCYCPITNLDNADKAYEWEFNGENECHRMRREMKDGQWIFTKEVSNMTAEQIELSGELKAEFPAYFNSLNLKDKNGNVLTLNDDGNGSFKEYLKAVVLASANKAIKSGIDVSHKKWLTLENGTAVDMDWEAYVHDITRMKPAPAFDNLELKSPENDLFGDNKIYAKHFTEYARAHSHAVKAHSHAAKVSEAGQDIAENHADSQTLEVALADPHIIKILNPMNYIDDTKATTAKHWRIRHGECDRDTSLAISAMLTLKLQNAGCEVDYHAPWDVPHAGDYDLDELFEWIDGVCKK